MLPFSRGQALAKHGGDALAFDSAEWVRLGALYAGGTGVAVSQEMPAVSPAELGKKAGRRSEYALPSLA